MAMVFLNIGSEEDWGPIIVEEEIPRPLEADPGEQVENFRGNREEEADNMEKKRTPPLPDMSEPPIFFSTSHL